MATAADWISAARPRTLPAAIAPVIAGTGVAIALNSFVWWKALLALVVSLALQVGVNYANDYSDGIRGTDADRVGPMRLVGSGAAEPGVVKRAAFAAFGVAGLAGLVLAATSGWWLVIPGVLAVVAAWFYTGGPKPYGYSGWGEVFVFVFFGLFAVNGTTYVQAGRISYGSVALSIGIGLLACALLIANNLRDVPTDAATGKRTLAVILGEQMNRRIYLLMVGGALLAPVVIGLRRPWVLLGLLSIVLAIPPAKAVWNGARGPKLIGVLAATGRLEFGYAVLCAVGMALERAT
ncbi:1,4-dihydroxy-2-naphthoate polyprenyltransferase [Nakamurella aerolata]|uniref:1,4-dihydroxy-2-naphthoate octaprenyltransferase n=1 Tax=Nakamurella aerolata TaxID=1656892 RepID=A0A849A6I2_9ACTN|nr:1,4-dihydroxy-2-naphthoate polyprenyltransferase [Nakamurella aerolata]